MGWFFNNTNPNFITIDKSQTFKNDLFTHVSTFLILYIITTTLVYRVAQHNVNRQVDIWI